MRTFSAQGNNVRNAVSAVKKLVGDTKLRIASQVDHGDGLYRVVLSSGDVVEVTVQQHARCEAVQVG